MIEVINLTPVELLIMIGLFYLGRHQGIKEYINAEQHKAKLDKVLKDAYKDLSK